MRQNAKGRHLIKGVGPWNRKGDLPALDLAVDVVVMLGHDLAVDS